MPIAHQNSTWLLLTITATFAILSTLIVYIIMRSLSKKQENITGSQASSLANQTNVKMYALTTALKRIKTLSEHVSRSAENQSTALINTSAKCTETAATAKAIEDQYNTLNKHINQMSVTLERVNSKITMAENQVKAIKNNTQKTILCNNNQRQHTTDDNAIVLSLQTRIDELKQKITHLDTKLSILDSQHDNVNHTINILSNNLKEQGTYFRKMPNTDKSQ